MMITLERWKCQGRHQPEIDAALRRWQARYDRYLDRRRKGPVEVKRLFLQDTGLTDELLEDQIDWEYFGNFGYELSSEP